MLLAALLFAATSLAGPIVCAAVGVREDDARFGGGGYAAEPAVAAGALQAGRASDLLLAWFVGFRAYCVELLSPCGLLLVDLQGLLVDYCGCPSVGGAG